MRKLSVSQQTYRVQVLDRMMAVLHCFTLEVPERTFAELLQKVQLNKSTLYRLLEVMRSYELINVDRTTGKYSLGMKLFELGMISINRMELTKLAIPALETLSKQSGETAHLCLLEGNDVIYVAKVESRLPFRVPSNIGRRNPAYCTGVGKALLANISQEQLDAYLERTNLRRYTRNTITSTEELRSQLRQIRARGYSIDDQEMEEGLRCIGAPIFDHTGNVVAAISIAGPTVRVDKKSIKQLASFVMSAAQSMSKALGSNTTRTALLQTAGSRSTRVLDKIRR